jgi:hypothetical protein
MTKEEKALKEVEAYQWMKSKGYDRRACKDVAPILVSYLSEELSKLHQPTVSGLVCPQCGCNKLQDDGLDYRSCLNVLCEWNGQIGR